MQWTTGGLLAVFDGDRGAFFLAMLIALLVAGTALLVVNLSARPRAPPQPKWEAVADDAPAPAKAAAPRRRA